MAHISLSCTLVLLYLQKEHNISANNEEMEASVKRLKLTNDTLQPMEEVSVCSSYLDMHSKFRMH